jgi:hypothetical protein
MTTMGEEKYQARHRQAASSDVDGGWGSLKDHATLSTATLQYLITKQYRERRCFGAMPYTQGTIDRAT